MTNSIPYFDKLVQWNDSLAGAPVGVLVFILCIASGYVWKVIKVLPNRFTPLAVMVAGSIAHPAILWPGWSALARSMAVGFIIGFAAWIFHRMLLKRLEDWLGAKISDDDTTVTKKEDVGK